MSRADRSSSQDKSYGGRIRRWFRRRQRQWAIKSEERRIARELAAKARLREKRERDKSTPENEAPPKWTAETAPVAESAKSTDQDSQEARPARPAVPVQPAPATPLPIRGFFDQMRRYRELRRDQIRQRRLDRAARNLERSNAAARKKQSSFGVGSTELSASDVRIPYRQRPIYLIRRTYRRMIKQRVPHWVAAMSPALILLVGTVIPSVVLSRGLAANALPFYRAKWADAFQAARWKEAEMAGLRVVASDLAEKQDILAFFDTLVAAGEFRKAVYQLISRESSQRDVNLAEYRFDMADRFLTRLDGSQELTELAFQKLNESLIGPLPQEKQIRARKILASANAVRGDLASSLAILQPIESLDLISHCDVLWLGWNINPAIGSTAYLNEVRESLRQVTERLEKSEAADSQEIAARARMSALLGEDEAFISWVKGDPRIPAADKAKWLIEIENLALVRVLRTEPLDPKQAWKRLKIVLDREPDNLEMLDSAIGLSFGPPERTTPEAQEFVLRKLRSDNVQSNFVGLLCMAAHSSGQWALAAESYEKLTKLDPSNAIAMNNLAGLRYKVPPYDYASALALVDRALAITPDNPSFLETRGQILARMGRIEEARNILEGCIPEFPEEWNLHNTLAQIYEYEGKQDLAEVHREKLAELKRPSNAPLESRIEFPQKKAAPEPAPKP